MEIPLIALVFFSWVTLSPNVYASTEVRINCGGHNQVDVNGLIFFPDAYFLGGAGATVTPPSRVFSSQLPGQEKKASSVVGGTNKETDSTSSNYTAGQSGISGNQQGSTSLTCCSVFQSSLPSFPMPPLNTSIRMFPNSDDLNCYEVPTSPGFHFVRLTFVRYAAGVLRPSYGGGAKPRTVTPPPSSESSDSSSAAPTVAHGVSNSTIRNTAANETDRYTFSDIRDASFSVVIEGAPREVIHMSEQHQWHTVEYLVRVMDGAATVCFLPVKGVPYVNTLEVLKPKFQKFGRAPWLPPLKTLWRINSGGGEIIPSRNTTGRSWLPDGACSASPATPQGQRTVLGAREIGSNNSSTVWVQGRLQKQSSYSPAWHMGSTRLTRPVVASVQTEEDLKVFLPAEFLDTVKRPASGSTRFKYNFELPSTGPSVRSFLVALYFLEVDSGVAVGQRLLDISINRQQCVHDFDVLSAANGSRSMPVSVTCCVVLALAPGRGIPVLRVSVKKALKSVYGPQVSGVEVYQMLPSYLARRNISLEKRAKHFSFVSTSGSNSFGVTSIPPSPSSPDAPSSSSYFPITPVIVAACGGVVLIVCIAGFSLLWWHQTEARRRRSQAPSVLQQGSASDGMDEELTESAGITALQP